MAEKATRICVQTCVKTYMCAHVQAVKAAEDAAIQAAQAAQQAEAGGNPVDVVAKATLATTRCSQVDSSALTDPEYGISKPMLSVPFVALSPLHCASLLPML